nr:MAG TPA: hypothetical protein [Caudoviricetes sp.]
MIESDIGSVFFSCCPFVSSFNSFHIRFFYNYRI